MITMFVIREKPGEGEEEKEKGGGEERKEGER